jgi:hypothetical protein
MTPSYLRESFRRLSHFAQQFAHSLFVKHGCQYIAEPRHEDGRGTASSNDFAGRSAAMLKPEGLAACPRWYDLTNDMRGCETKIKNLREFLDAERAIEIKPEKPVGIDLRLYRGQQQDWPSPSLIPQCKCSSGGPQEDSKCSNPRYSRAKREEHN